MTFLPIVDRELRVAARRKSTRHIRVGTTVGAIVVVAGYLFFSPMFRSAAIGGLLFQILTAYAFGMCVLAGVFVTSDCLSEEKRAGTLGLLFLTDLEGAGVVVGKFIARSLNPFLAWLAILPVISLAIILGGVTGAEFWRVALALLNTLFLSLAIGICVSAWSTDAQRASSISLGLLVLLAGLLPAATYLSSGSALTQVLQLLNRCSPFYNYRSALDVAYAVAPGKFWSSLMLVQALGWMALLAATMKIHRAWQDEPVNNQPNTKRQSRARAARARRATDNPVSGLLQTSTGLTLVIWMIALVWVALCFGWFTWTGKPVDWPVLLLGSKAVEFLLKVIFVTQVCRFFVEARRTGVLEMLLCTPVTDVEILGAHWRHLRRLFILPGVVLLLPVVTATLLGQSFRNSGVGALFNNAFTKSFSFSSGGLFVLGTVTDFLALAWVGLWFALSLKKPSLAPGMTVLCVLIPPVFLFFIPDIFYDMLLFAWARERLDHDFRQRLAEQFGPLNLETA